MKAEKLFVDNRASLDNRSEIPDPKRVQPWEGVRDLLPRLLPALSLVHASMSLLVSWVAMLLLGIKHSAWVYPEHLRHSCVDTVTSWADPLLVQSLSVLFVAGLFTVYCVRIGGRRRTWPIVFTLVGWAFVIGISLVAALLLEQTIFKPTFKFPRPCQEGGPGLGDPWFTSYVKSLFIRINVLGASQVTSGFQDVPSGFVIRQTVVFFFVIWLVSQSDFPGLFHLPQQSTRLVIGLGSFLAVLWVAFSRLYRQNHSLLAISVAAGVASCFFWSALGTLYVIRRYDVPGYRSFISYLLIQYVSFSLVFAYYSNAADNWFVVSLVYIFILFFSLAISSRRAKHTGGPI